MKQLRKEQIPIPYEMGRSMLGVIDETGRLQYGQVFVRYTRSIHVKLPPETATRLVLTGSFITILDFFLNKSMSQKPWNM